MTTSDEKFTPRLPRFRVLGSEKESCSLCLLPPTTIIRGSGGGEGGAVRDTDPWEWIPLGGGAVCQHPHLSPTGGQQHRLRLWHYLLALLALHPTLECVFSSASVPGSRQCVTCERQQAGGAQCCNPCLSSYWVSGTMKAPLRTSISEFGVQESWLHF